MDKASTLELVVYNIKGIESILPSVGNIVSYLPNWIHGYNTC
jgi:hypothetical protein